MLGVNAYAPEFVAAARARIAADIAAYDAAALGGSPLEAHYFNNLVLALDHSFVHRLRKLEGKDGNPLNETRLIADSLIEHGGVFTTQKAIKYKPEDALLQLVPGDTIQLARDDFEALANAFLAEIAARYKP